MARARTRLGEDYDVVAVIGDGALTGGLAYEGLSNAGQSGEPLVVILNDNAMSIGSNVGGMAKLLSRMRVKPGYFAFKRWYRSTVGRVKPVYELAHRVKEGVKDAVLPENMFDDLGFYYLGPVDGHDVAALESAIAWARDMRVPVLLHVITRKGRGYPRAELDPELYHGVGPFDPANGRGQKERRQFFHCGGLGARPRCGAGRARLRADGGDGRRHRPCSVSLQSTRSAFSIRASPRATPWRWRRAWQKRG